MSVDPTLVPNFYGYPSDVVCDPGTGRVWYAEERFRPKPWSLALGLVVVVALAPLLLIGFLLSCRRPWRGAIEADHK